MTHLLLMTMLAALIAVVFGAIAREDPKQSLLYGLKVFAEFMVIGIALAWLLYFLPR